MKKFSIYSENTNFDNLATAFLDEINAACALSCEIVICDESEIRRLNLQTRAIDAVTDVLSFPTLDTKNGSRIYKSKNLQDVDEEGNLFIGSIVICEKRAKEQAEEYGHSFERELYYLATHGVCHLLGYDHMDESDKKLMRALEEKVLNKLGILRG